MEHSHIQSKETYIDDIDKARRMADAEDPYHDEIAALQHTPSGKGDDYKINRLEYRAKRAGEKAGVNYDYDNDDATEREEDTERAHRIALAEKPYRDQIVAVETESEYFGLGTLRSLARRAFDAGSLAAANHDTDMNPGIRRVEDTNKAYVMATASRPLMDKTLRVKEKLERVEDSRDSDWSYPRGFGLLSASHKSTFKIPALQEKVANLRAEADKRAEAAGEKYDSSNR